VEKSGKLILAYNETGEEQEKWENICHNLERL